VVRNTVVRAQDRRRGCKEADDRGRLQRVEACQDQNADLSLRVGSDAAPANERIPAAEPQGSVLRRGLRGGRVAGAARPLAGWWKVAPGEGCPRRQHLVHDARSLQQLPSPVAVGSSRAYRRQLRLL